MFKTDQNEHGGRLSKQFEKKIEQLTEQIISELYGEDGPPKELTFREIEDVGFRVAQMAARQFEETVAERHQRHFNEALPCPQCGKDCQPQDSVNRELHTRLGPVELTEIRFHCDACRRSFFPSA